MNHRSHPMETTHGRLSAVLTFLLLDLLIIWAQLTKFSHNDFASYHVLRLQVQPYNIFISECYTYMFRYIKFVGPALLEKSYMRSYVAPHLSTCVRPHLTMLDWFCTPELVCYFVKFFSTSAFFFMFSTSAGHARIGFVSWEKKKIFDFLDRTLA